MNAKMLKISKDATHHVTQDGVAAYTERFDEVLQFHNPGLAPVRLKGQAWHIRTDGSPAYPRRFCRTFGFYDGLAAVIDADGWHHINPDGSDAYVERYHWCGNFQENIGAVRDLQRQYFHIHPNGEPLYAERWSYAGDFKDGIAVVQNSNGRSTHIDVLGNQTHGVWYLDLDVFHKRFARAKDEGGWTHINEQGRPIYARRFATVEPFYNGQARVETMDGALEIINETGETLFALREAHESEFLKIQQSQALPAIIIAEAVS
jgi:hypothetical protein